MTIAKFCGKCGSPLYKYSVVDKYNTTTGEPIIKWYAKCSQYNSGGRPVHMWTTIGEEWANQLPGKDDPKPLPKHITDAVEEKSATEIRGSHKRWWQRR